MPVVNANEKKHWEEALRSIKDNMAGLPRRIIKVFSIHFWSIDNIISYLTRAIQSINPK